MRGLLRTLVLGYVVLLGRAGVASGDGTFLAPLKIYTTHPGPVTVHTGDFNADGKLDIMVASGVASNVASGSPGILVLFQNPQNRLDWKTVPVNVGTSSVFVRAGDFDLDGIEDIMVADTGTTAYFVRSRGDQTFDRPVAITEARGARWIAVGDWDVDGALDIATANLTGGNVTTFWNNGVGNFLLTQTLAGAREHVLETSDYDGDAIPDLVLGTGLPGVTPHTGLGNGTFVPKGPSGVFSCVEYISTGDFDQDGLGDLACTCIDDGNAYAGVGLGDGQYRRTLGPLPAAGGTESTAIGDLNGDGNEDVAVVSNGSTALWVYPGRGNGSFLAPVIFGPTGLDPVFLVTGDLDADGHTDVVSGDEQSFNVSVFWGREGPRFLVSENAVTGFAGAKAMAIADLDGDGWQDLLLPHSTQPRVQVYLKPRGTPQATITRTVTTANKYTALEAADLDGDGVPDFAGASTLDNAAQVALLGDDGNPRSQLSMPAGVLPGTVAVGYLDGGPIPDLALPSVGSNTVSVFLGQPNGAFAEGRHLATTEKPKDVVLGDVDGDGRGDLTVMSQTAVVFHYGLGGGDFGAPVTLVQDLTKIYTDLALGDLTGDGIADVLVAEQKTTSLYLYPGKGGRQFDVPKALKLTFTSATTVRLADLDGDGRLDVTVTSPNYTATVFLNAGEGKFGSAVNHTLEFPPVGHRLADLDNDGALDLVAFSSTKVGVLLGNPRPTTPGRFVRADANADGQIDLSDALQTLFVLFAGFSTDCLDALDANDDGTVGTADAVRVLTFVLGSARSLPAPFPVAGPDPTPADALDCRRP